MTDVAETKLRCIACSAPGRSIARSTTWRLWSRISFPIDRHAAALSGSFRSQRTKSRSIAVR